jgi:hydroxymethylbilane synthase
MKHLRIGTRKSRLALWQTDRVACLLHAFWPELACRKITFVTQGDKTLDKALPDIGGKGLFTTELEEALRAGEIDIAVHSLKDLPVEQPAGIRLGAILERADVRDVLIARNGWTLDSLPAGARVGTSSLRRQAQLHAYRPDLEAASIRGNVDTRIRKVLEDAASGEHYDAVVLAAAGVTRLDLDEHISQWLPLELMLPAPGQGALGVQCRADDEETLDLLAAIEAREVRDCVTAERAFLNALGGGCATPVAAYAQVKDGQLLMSGLIASPDGSQRVFVSGNGPDPLELGRDLAGQALGKGAGQILAHFDSERTPLSGKRVLVSRATHQAGEFAEKLAARGAVPLLFPVIAFKLLPAGPLNASLAQIKAYDWLIFSSSNAVDFFFSAVTDSEFRAMSNGLKIAAVGPVTAAKLDGHHVTVDFVPDAFTGEQLALGLGDLEGKRVLLPRARIGRPETLQFLREQGAIVDDIPIYDTVAATPPAEALAEVERGLDVITFASPSSVRNFLKVTAQMRQPQSTQAVVACIGPSTAAEAEEHGLRVDVVAEQYTSDGLIAALEAYLRGRETP